MLYERTSVIIPSIGGLTKKIKIANGKYEIDRLAAKLAPRLIICLVWNTARNNLIRQEEEREALTPDKNVRDGGGEIIVYVGAPFAQISRFAMRAGTRFNMQ